MNITDIRDIEEIHGLKCIDDMTQVELEAVKDGQIKVYNKLRELENLGLTDSKQYIDLRPMEGYLEEILNKPTRRELEKLHKLITIQVSKFVCFLVVVGLLIYAYKLPEITSKYIIYYITGLILHYILYKLEIVNIFWNMFCLIYMFFSSILGYICMYCALDGFIPLYYLNFDTIYYSLVVLGYIVIIGLMLICTTGRKGKWK